MNRAPSTRQRKAKTKYLTYRIDEIPSKYSTKDQLKQCFHSDDKGHVHVKSFVPSISDLEGSEHTATVQYLADGEPRLDADVENIELDKDFRGFTPLNAPSENVAADVIAVTGLGGHAFGSWVNSKGDMWLRDYLPRDLQGRARILIYGYPSALQDGSNQSSLSDYSTCFMQDLMGIRSQHGIQDRPLVLIGHSLGGLIVKKALSDLRHGVLSRLPVRAILFFGTPHRGLNTKSLETMVQGQENAKLIKDLEPESAAIEHLRADFKRIANNFKIYSFVETRTTPMVTKIDEEWQRGTHREMMVSRNSAMLDCDTETVRMVTADHSDMVKLRKGQEGPYRYIVSIIKEALQSAPEKWEDFKQGKDVEPDLPSDPYRDDQQPEHGWKRSFNREASPNVFREASLEPDQSNISEVQDQDANTLPSQPPTQVNDQPEEVEENIDAKVLHEDSSPPPEYSPYDDDEAPEPGSVEHLRDQLESMGVNIDTDEEVDLAAQEIMFQLAYQLVLNASKPSLVEAEEIIRKLLDVNEDMFGTKDPRALRYIMLLADILRMQNKIIDAEHYWQVLLDRSASALGPSHETVLKNSARLIEFRLEHDMAEEAVELCRGLLDQRMEINGPTHRRTVDCELLLVNCLEETEEWAEVKERLENCLPELYKMLQDGDDDLVKPTVQLAKACIIMRDYEKSETLCRQAIDILRGNYYRDRPDLDLLETKKMFATALGKQGKHEAARDVLQEILQEITGLPEEMEFGTLEPWEVSLPRILCALGQQQSQINNSLELAEETLMKVFPLNETHENEFFDGETFIQTPRYLGRLCSDQGRYAEAEQWLSKALDKCNEWGEESSRPDILMDLALARRRAERPQIALTNYRQAIEEFEMQENYQDSYWATRNLAWFFRELENFVRAESTLYDLLNEQQREGSPADNHDICATMDLLADVLDAKGNPAAANDMRLQAMAYQQDEPEDSEQVQSDGLGVPEFSQGGRVSPQPGVTEDLALPTTKTWTGAFQDVQDVLYTLGIFSETVQQNREMLVLDCVDQGVSFQLAASGGMNSINIRLHVGPNMSSHKHIFASIQRLLEPTLVGNRVVAFQVQVPDGAIAAAAGDIVSLNEAVLRNTGILVGPREGPPTQARHRCQVKKTRLFKSSKKASFQMMHSLVYSGESAFLEYSFEWMQGEREVFDQTIMEILNTLSPHDYDFIWDRYGCVQQEDDGEEAEEGPVSDYNAYRY